MIRILLAAGALTIAVTACGNGDRLPNDEEAAAIATLVDAELTLDEQRCVLAGVLDTEIAPSAIIADDLTPDQSGQLLAATVECVEDLAQIDAFVQSFIDGAAESGTVLTYDEAQCAIRALDTDDIDSAVLACLGERADGAADYGDDAVLDLLWDQCEGGNAQACDELYRDSPIGSAYETYGRTCGGSLPDSIGLKCFEELG